MQSGAVLKESVINNPTNQEGLLSNNATLTSSPKSAALSLPPSRVKINAGSFSVLPSLSRLRSNMHDSPQHPSSDNDTHFDFETSAKKYLTDSESIVGLPSVHEADGSKVNMAVLDAFRWTNLRVAGEYIFPRISGKAREVLGSLDVGYPTVIATNGFVCVGTDRGVVLVFDFQQRLKCICGNENSSTSVYRNIASLLKESFFSIERIEN